MKRFRAISCIVWLLFAGCHYIGVSGGHGGEYNATSISVEGITKGEVPSDPNDNPWKDWMVISGMCYINSGERKFTPFFPVALGYDRGDEIGAYIKLGPELSADSGLFVMGIAGVTFAKYHKTGHEEDLLVEGMFGAGILYFPNDGNLGLQLNYDNRRGLSGGLGIRF